MNEYGFQIGNAKELLIVADNEKDALLNLIDNYWSIIEQEGNISLLGKVIEKKKITGIENYEEDEE